MDKVGCPFSCSYLLQVTILSAEALLTTGKKPVKKNAFVVVSSGDYDDHAKLSRCNTGIVKEGGSNPAWNEELEISVPMHVKHITLEVRCATSSRSTNKSHSIGVARVPTSDFIRSKYHNNANDYLHFLSYRLRDRFGEPNGIINFSVKVLKGGIQLPQKPNHMYEGSSTKIEGWSGYNRRENLPQGRNSTCVGVNGHFSNPSTAVVGIPATWYNNSCHA